METVRKQDEQYKETLVFERMRREWFASVQPKGKIMYFDEAAALEKGKLFRFD